MTTKKLRSDFHDSLFQQNPVPMFLCERGSLQIVEANDAAVKRYGYSGQELCGMTVRELATGRTAAAVDKALEDGNTRARLLVTHANSRGKCFAVELRGAPCQYGGRKLYLLSAIDLAGGGECDPGLVRSEDIHRSLVDECPFGIYRLNLTTSCMEQANPALLHTLGHTLAEVCAIPMANFYENPAERARYLAILNENGSVRDFETHFRTKSGKTVHVSLCGYLRRDAKTGERYIQGYVVDITRQRELEEQLSHSHRMDAVGRLAGGVAHDFNNIAQSISLSCELALQSPLPARLESNLLDIMHQTTRAAEITRQLLAFSRRQVLQPRVVDVNECVRKAHALLKRTVGVDVSIELRLDETIDHVLIDPEQLTLVLMHLADNAREAMPRGGALRISTASEQGNSDAALGPVTEPCTVLTVADTGTGMDEITLSHIFEPFFSTKETTLTTGLGLSTVHGIIAQSKGRIECSSSPGDGATFRIYLPVAQSQPSPRNRPRSDSRATGILLAEDDPIVNKHLAHALKQAGFSVDSTSSGMEALDAFDPQRHQLVVTDIIMPELDGVGLTCKLCERFPALPVVLISGFSEELSVLRSLPEGNLCYLQKPFPASRLISSIHELLEQSRGQRTSP